MGVKSEEIVCALAIYVRTANIGKQSIQFIYSNCANNRADIRALACFLKRWIRVLVTKEMIVFSSYTSKLNY